MRIQQVDETRIYHGLSGIPAAAREEVRGLPGVTAVLPQASDLHDPAQPMVVCVAAQREWDNVEPAVLAALGRHVSDRLDRPIRTEVGTRDRMLEVEMGAGIRVYHITCTFLREEIRKIPGVRNVSPPQTFESHSAWVSAPADSDWDAIDRAILELIERYHPAVLGRISRVPFRGFPE